MKWLTPKQPEHGDKRKFRKFAWFPTKCEDGSTRWLETIFVVETYFKSSIRPNCQWWSINSRQYFSRDSK
jgi:hypothetical protein